MAFYTFVTTLKNKIVHVGYDDNGNKFTRTENFKPILATLTDNPQTHGFKTIQNKDVQFIKFDDINAFNKYNRDYSDIFDLYSSIAPQFQFINRTYGDLSTVDKSQIRRFILDIEAHAEPGEGFPEPKIALWPIRAITIHDSKTDNYFLISLGPWGKTAKMLVDRGMDLDKIQFKRCKSENELFKTLVEIFEGCKPDILSGYNSDGFDIPYILNRAAMINFDDIKRLSPFGITNVEWKELDNGNTQYNCRILGVALLDYMKMYKKYRSANRESFKLDFLLHFEINQAKIDFHDMGYDTFSALWNGDPDLYNTYNIYDVGGMVDMEKKLRLFDLHYVRTYRSKCNFENAMGTITYWDVFMYNYLWEQKIIIPPIHRNERVSYPGAYVKQPIPGIYKYIFSVDLNSLYPHIIQQWNISPECLIETENIQDRCYYDELVDAKEQKMLMRDMKFMAPDIVNDFIHLGENDDGLARIQTLHPDFLDGKIKGNRKYILAPNGVYFSREKEGFVSILMKKLYAERQQVKKKQLFHEQELENLETSGQDKKSIKYLTQKSLIEGLIASQQAEQLGIKTDINSFYGAYANPYFRYYDIRCATAITLAGQLAQRWCDEYVVKNLSHYNIISQYGDTDSVVGNTIINTSIGNITIDEFFKKIKGNIEHKDNDNFLKHISENVTGKSLNINTEQIENKKIKYVMKHKVKKRLYKITVNEKSVIVTADHSIIIKRNNKILSIKPNNIIYGDTIYSDVSP
jgi:DNA polymerase elongation subunit (family B)